MEDEYDSLARVFVGDAVKSGNYTKRKLCPVLASRSYGAIRVMLIIWLAKSFSKFFNWHALSFTRPEFLNVVVQQYWQVESRRGNLCCLGIARGGAGNQHSCGELPGGCQPVVQM